MSQNRHVVCLNLFERWACLRAADGVVNSSFCSDQIWCQNILGLPVSLRWFLPKQPHTAMDVDDDDDFQVPNTKKTKLSHEETTASWTQLCDGLVNETCGFVSSTHALQLVIKRFETLTTTRYTILHNPKDFGTTELNKRAHRMQWEHGPDKGPILLPFDGIPFMVLASIVLECQHGPERNQYNKMKYAEKTKDNPCIKHRFLKHDTKKLGCNAKIHAYEVVRFPDYKLSVDSKGRRQRKSKAVKTDLCERPSSVTQQRRLYICLPQDSEHTAHPIGEMGGLFQPVDNQLIQKIQELVSEGVRNVCEMKRHLRIFTEHEIFRNQKLPARNNRRYFPSLRTIKNHMYNATVKQRVSMMDQENVSHLAQKWQARGDHVFFRPYKSEGEDSSDLNTAEAEEGEPEGEEDTEETIITSGRELSNRLLVVHQAPWQKRLLHRYGQEMAFLDATYKTTKYAMPLYFLAVKTNCNYVVVAEFVVQDETTKSITEALSIVKEWNPQWRPKHLITDLCQEEINSVETLFPDCNVLICTFHREQAWERWTAKKENGVSSPQIKASLLAKLRDVANSHTEKSLQAALDCVYSSKEWNENEKLRKWFSGTWMRHIKRWVSLYRRQRLLVYVNTNNGLERQNGAFKHKYIRTLRKETLAGMLRILVEEYLPDQYETYIDANTYRSGQGRQCNPDIPVYLHNRPDYLVDHCMKRLSSTTEINIDRIQVLDPTCGCFHVDSSVYGMSGYRICFMDPNMAGLPSCQCQDWLRWHLPCKHMLAIIQSGNWSWDKLCEEYRESPFLTLDEDVFFKCAGNHEPVIEDCGEDCVEVCGEEVEKKGLDIMATYPEPTNSVIPPTRSQISDGCDELARIKNLLHESVDSSAVSVLIEELRKARVNFEQSMNKENGIVLTKPTTKHKVQKLKSKFHPLPASFKRSRKHPFAQRHGSKAAMMRRMYQCKLSVDELIKQCTVSKPRPDFSKPGVLSTDEDKTELSVEVGQGDYLTDGLSKPAVKLASIPSCPTSLKHNFILSDFTPPLKRGRLLVDPLLTFGPINCSLLHIKSLEPSLTRGVLSVLKTVDPAFKIGWLFDDIIDAFLWCLKQTHPDVQVIGSTVMLVLQNGLPSGRVWRGEDLSKVAWIFAPWNPTGAHWTLVAVNIPDKTVIYLNPNQSVDVSHSMFVVMLKDFFIPFLARHGWENFTIISPEHYLQKDSSSCGVFVCWYARQLLEAKPLTQAVDQRQMRFDIFQTIRGDCLQRLQNSQIRLSVCPICMEVNSNPMVSCTKCKQWYHCDCYGTTVAEAKERSILHCPPLTSPTPSSV